ncbi:MAG: hypothetical protein IJU91_03495, partial [Selenomonadaceae bacterium]|nr:hypothetical protein [Selenomonadaceae bacterium]
VAKNFALEDATELRKEIELINPDVILCCNTFKMLTAKKPEEESKRKRERVFYYEELTKGSKGAYRWGDKLIMDFWHPAQFYYPMMMNNVQYYTVREFCRAGISTLGPFSWAEL